MGAHYTTDWFSITSVVCTHIHTYTGITCQILLDNKTKLDSLIETVLCVAIHFGLNYKDCQTEWKLSLGLCICERILTFGSKTRGPMCQAWLDFYT